MREAFENSLRDNPDDLAGWCAFADWLTEQGDPLGEFMQTQIALEDESRSKEERDRLKAREAELLKQHEREWLGELAPHLIPPPELDYSDPNYDWDRPATPKAQYRWRRGRLAELTVECITVRLAQALADAPAAWALNNWHVVTTAYNSDMQDAATPRRATPPQEYRSYDEWLDLLGAPFLSNVRVFQLGDENEPPEEGWCDNHTRAYGIERLVAEMLRVEELHLICKSYNSATLFELPNLTRLRVLRMYALGEPYDDDNHDIPLDILAANPALRNLTHLYLHPHYDYSRSFIPLAQVRALVNSPHLTKLTHLQLRLSDAGDDGVREIIASGILKRLKWLDLRHGCITDEGAKLFAACPDAKNLERLDLTRNAVTAAGLAVLRAAGINAVANNPLTQEELDSREYLREGDFE